MVMELISILFQASFLTFTFFSFKLYNWCLTFPHLPSSTYPPVTQAYNFLPAKNLDKERIPNKAVVLKFVILWFYPSVTFAVGLVACSHVHV